MEMIKSFCQMPLVLAVALHCGQLQAAAEHADVPAATGIKLMLKSSEQESKLVSAQHVSAMGTWSLAYSSDHLTVVKSLDSVAATYSSSDLSVPSIEAIWTDKSRNQVWLQSPTSLKVFQLGNDGKLTFLAGMNLSATEIHLSADFGGLLIKTTNVAEYQLMLLDRNSNSFASQGAFTVPAHLSSILLDLKNLLVLTGHESTETTLDVLNVFSLDANTATLTSRGSLTGLTASWTGSKGTLHDILAKQSGGYVVVHSRGMTYVSLDPVSQLPQLGVEYLQPFTKDSVSVISGDVASILQDKVLYNIDHHVTTGFDFISKYPLDGLADKNPLSVDGGKVYTVRSGVVTSHAISAVDKDAKSLIVGASQLYLPVALDAASGRNLQLPGGELVLLGDNAVSVMRIDSNEKLRQTQHYQHNTNFTDSNRLHLLAASEKSFYALADKQLFAFQLSDSGKLTLTGQSQLPGTENASEITVLGANSQFMLHSTSAGAVGLYRLTANGPVLLTNVQLTSAPCMQALANAVLTDKSAYILSRNGCISQVSLESASLGMVKAHTVTASPNARLELSAGYLVVRDVTAGSSQIARLGAAGEPVWLPAQTDVWKNQQTAFSFGGRFHLTSAGDQQAQIYETAQADGRLLSAVNLTAQVPQVNSGLLVGQYLLLQDQASQDRLDIFSINRRPVLQSAPAVARVNQGVASSVDLAGSVIDEDQDPITYRTAGQSNVTVLSNGTVQFPATLAAVNGEVALTAEDNNGFSVSLTLPYIVNKSPVSSGNTVYTVNQGADFLIDLKQNVSDPEGHTIRFESLNKTLTISETGMLSGKFADVAARKDQIRLTDQLGAVSVVEVTVQVNAAPSFSGTSSYSMTEKSNFTLDLTSLFKDAENQKLTFSATGLPAGLQLNADGQISGQATAVGTFAVQVKATDSAGASGSQTLNFTVNAAPVTPPPVTPPTQNQGGSGGSSAPWALAALALACLGRRRKS